MPDLPESLTRRTAFLLRLALTRAEAMGELALQEIGVAGREYGLLELLRHRSPQTQIALGRQLSIDRTTCAALLNGLDERGLVRRAADPANRRANLISLTADGEHIRAAASAALAACDDRFQSRLSDGERFEMRRMLQALIAVPE